MRYETNGDADIIIQMGGPEGTRIISKCSLKWESLLGNSKYESYARAVYLGEGSWDDLYEIDEWEAEDMLRKWGYKEQ